MRPRVGAEEQQSGLANLLRFQVKGQGVVPRETLVAAAVHACKPGPVDSVGATTGAHSAAWPRPTRQEQQAASALVQVVEGVEMDTVRAKGGQRSDDALAQEIVLHRGIPLLRIRSLQIVVQHAGRTG